jgi:hypothetical protein
MDGLSTAVRGRRRSTLQWLLRVTVSVGTSS